MSASSIVMTCILHLENTSNMTVPNNKFFFFNCNRHSDSIDDLRMFYQKKERKILRKQQTYRAFREKLKVNSAFIYFSFI